MHDEFADPLFAQEVEGDEILDTEEVEEDDLEDTEEEDFGLEPPDR